MIHCEGINCPPWSGYKPIQAQRILWSQIDKNEGLQYMDRVTEFRFDKGNEKSGVLI